MINDYLNMHPAFKITYGLHLSGGSHPPPTSSTMWVDLCVTDSFPPHRLDILVSTGDAAPVVSCVHNPQSFVAPPAPTSPSSCLD
jgi:hypothetical protein